MSKQYPSALDNLGTLSHNCICLSQVGGPYINFPILKSLLKILVDRFIRDFTDQSEI